MNKKLYILGGFFIERVIIRNWNHDGSMIISVKMPTEYSKITTYFTKNEIEKFIDLTPKYLGDEWIKI